LGSGRRLARQRWLTSAVADLRQSGGAGECQHGSGEECVGSHVVEVTVLMLEVWKRSVFSWMKGVLERTMEDWMALERERVGCED